MNATTERAFRQSEYAARLLCEMKYGINEVKTKGGIDERTKLEALMGFLRQAEDILKNMQWAIEEALSELDKKIDMERLGAYRHPNSACPDCICPDCGQEFVKHAPSCPISQGLRKGN